MPQEHNRVSAVTAAESSCEEHFIRWNFDWSESWDCFHWKTNSV